VARFLAKTYDRQNGNEAETAVIERIPFGYDIVLDGERHYAMSVRFRETPYGLQVSLIRTRRECGKVRHEHIAGLGAIAIPASAADRIDFWRRLHAHLSALSNRIGDEQGKILGAVHERIPMPTPDEQRDSVVSVSTARS
jgi:hypothetical protein